MTGTKRVRNAGLAYMVGSGLWLVMIGAQTAIWGFEPPARSAAFYTFEATYVIMMLLLLYGFFGVLWSDGLGNSIFGKIAFGIGVLGHLIFVAGEVHSLMIGTLSDLIAMGALVSALGILLTGIAVVVAKRWQGWARWMPLLAGLYPFLFMFPFYFFSSDDPNGFLVAGWGLARFALGMAIRSQANVYPSTKLPQAKV